MPDTSDGSKEVARNEIVPSSVIVRTHCRLNNFKLGRNKLGHVQDYNGFLRICNNPGTK